MPEDPAILVLENGPTPIFLLFMWWVQATKPHYLTFLKNNNFIEN